MNFIELGIKIAEKLGINFLSRKQLEHSKNLDSYHKAVEALHLPTIEALGEYKKEKTLELIKNGNFSSDQAELIASSESEAMMKALKNQSNISTSILHSIDFIQKLGGENKEDSFVMPEDDWINEWANNAGKFSKESAQKLWGAVLAGKMCNADSYSFQTMDIIRKMSDSDAKLFITACSIQISNSIFTESDIWKNYLTWENIFHLHDLGLVDSNSITTFVHFTDSDCIVKNLHSAKISIYPAMTNNLAFVYSSEVSSIFQKQSCFRLTKAGIELLGLITQVGDDIHTDTDYLYKLGVALKEKSGHLKSGFTITDKQNIVLTTNGLDINPQTGENSIIA